MPAYRAATGLALLLFACAACNPNPLGRCQSSGDCEHGAVCNQADKLCEAPDSICTPACTGGTVCKSGVCTIPSQPGVPSVQLVVAQNALFSPSMSQVHVEVTADSSVVLGGLSLSVSQLDGGTFDGGFLASAMVAQASADAGIALVFAPGAQGPGNLLATLDYTNADAGGTVHSATVPVRIDAVPPAISLSIESAPDQVSGWFPRTVDGGIAIDATLDDTPLGSGPDAGVLTITNCPAVLADAGQCTFAGVAGPLDGGARSYRFTFPRTLATAGAQAAVAFTIDGVDNAGNHADQNGSVLIDDVAPVTDTQVAIVNTDAGTIGEDGLLWFPAGTNGVDVELALGAVDQGAGLDPNTFLLTLDATGIDPSQDPHVPGFLPGDGKVHFKVPTGRTSKREGPLAFVITLADKVGNAAAPVHGQILVDDAPPTVSLAAVDYSDLGVSPARATVCAANATCGRGPAAAPDHALRDDVVTTTFSVVDCGVGVDTGASPACALYLDPGDRTNLDFATLAVSAGIGVGHCANGSSNPLHLYTCTFPLATSAAALPETASGTSNVYVDEVGFDRIGGEADSPPPPLDGGPGVIHVSRWRWKAPLGGHATGAPALIPLTPAQSNTTARRLVVPVDGTASPSSPDGLELFESNGNETAISLGDGGTFDNASGDVAIGAGGTPWVSGTPAPCDAGLATCTNLWVARAGAGAAACPVETGAITSLAVRDADAGSTEVAVVGLADAGLGALGEIAGSFKVGNTTALSCAHVSSTARSGVATVTGVSLAQGELFVASDQGFYSVQLDRNGQLSGQSAQAPFIASGSDPLTVLLSAPSILVAAASNPGLPYFNAVNALGGPSAWGLREAVASSTGGGNGGAGQSTGCNGDCWIAASAPWSDVTTAARVLHSPVFDAKGIYTVDASGTLQLSELGSASTVATSALGAVDFAGVAAPQLVSPPVLFAGGAAGSSALLVQSNGLVRLVSLAASPTVGAAPTLSAASALSVGPSTASQPPAPVLDARGSGAVAYVVDGSGACASGSGSCGWVWALQLDSAPVTATPSVWPRPQHDSCNSREAEGSCP